MTAFKLLIAETKTLEPETYHRRSGGTIVMVYGDAEWLPTHISSEALAMLCGPKPAHGELPDITFITRGTSGATFTISYRHNDPEVVGDVIAKTTERLEQFLLSNLTLLRFMHEPLVPGQRGFYTV